LSSSLRSSLSAFAMARELRLALIELAIAVMNGESTPNTICGPPDLCRRLGGPHSENPLASMVSSWWRRLRLRSCQRPHQRQQPPQRQPPYRHPRQLQHLLQLAPVCSRYSAVNIYSASQAETRGLPVSVARLHPRPCIGAHVDQHESVRQCP
jgi:hypothetical protein